MTRTRLERVEKRWWSASIALLAALGGCDDGPSLRCGDGTQKMGNQCLPIADDAGTQSEDDAGDVTCGAGTVLMNGQCVEDPSMELKCGEGTVEDAGVCVLAPPAPPSVEGLKVSHVALRVQGQLLGDGDELSQYYPVEVSVGVTYAGDKANLPVVFALGEAPPEGQEKPDLGFCIVGGFELKHPGGKTATESIASGTMYIPRECLKAAESARTVSPIVMIDPDGTVAGEDSALSHSVSFLKIDAEDPEVAECRRDPSLTGAKGTCNVALKVAKSPGVDFELSELTLESAVAVLNRCGNDWAAIANGSANIDADRPPSYRCNENIVPDFQRDSSGEIVKDSAGHPVQATYTNTQGQTLPKWVYGAADISVDVTVLAHGMDDSKPSTTAEAMAAGGDETKIVNNVLTDHGLQIVYHVRPAKAATADWKPLYLHAQGEQAKAGEDGESGQEPTQFEETEIVPAAPHYYTHGLYVENDCGERNQASCNAALNPRTDIIYGDWSQENDFLVRACLVPVDDTGAEDKAFDADASNNCKEIPLKVVRHATTGSASNASSYGFNYQFKDGAGSDATLRLGWDMHTWNNLNTSGITIDNEAAMTLGSKLVGTTDIMRGWAKGAAYVSLVGSYYDYGVNVFGTKVYGDAKAVPEYHWEKDWNVSKELRRGTVLWAGPIPVNVEIRFSGQAGLVVNLDIVGVNKPFTADEESETYLLEKAGSAATRIGLAQLSATPYGNMVVVASASLSAAAVRAGVAGQLTLFDLRVPLTGRLWWGMTNLNPLTLKVGVWGDLKLNFTTMSGRVYLFAERWNIKICSKKVAFVKVKYPCGEEWNNIWDYTIANWGGWRWNQTLWSSPYKELAIP